MSILLHPYTSLALILAFTALAGGVLGLVLRFGREDAARATVVRDADGNLLACRECGGVIFGDACARCGLPPGVGLV